MTPGVNVSPQYFLNHERFLYYQSIYDTPRWSSLWKRRPPLRSANGSLKSVNGITPSRSGQGRERLPKSAAGADILPASALAAVSDVPWMQESTF